MGLEYYLNLNYEINLVKKQDTYWLTIKELSFIVYDKSLDNAYTLLQNKKEQYFKDMIASGMDKYIIEPRSKIYKNSLLKSILPTSIKYTIILIVFIVGLQFFHEYLLTAREHIINNEYISEKVANLVVNTINQCHSILENNNSIINNSQD